MKYLKKFNEELKDSTYRSAARKLKKMGHDDRADYIGSHAGDIIYKEKLEKYSKYGTYQIRISDMSKLNTNSDNKNPSNELTLDFHLDISFVEDHFIDSVDYNKNGGGGTIWLSVGLIPTKESIEKCKEFIEDDTFNYNGSYCIMAINIYFDLFESSIEFKSIEIDSQDPMERYYVKIANRQSAGKLKMLLKKMFGDKNFNYPGYEGGFYDQINNVIGAQEGFSSDYGFNSEQISELINDTSANLMY